MDCIQSKTFHILAEKDGHGCVFICCKFLFVFFSSFPRGGWYQTSV